MEVHIVTTTVAVQWLYVLFLLFSKRSCLQLLSSNLCNYLIICGNYLLEIFSWIANCVDSANNFAMQHKRKTISGQDVLDAMKEMEFERFVEPLRRSLEGTTRYVDR